MQSPVNLFTAEEYLQLEQTSEIRHEYLGGQVFAISGGSKQHNLIAGNIYSRLRSHLRGGSCSVFMADIKVRIELANQNKSIFYYPDVIVSCDPKDQDRFSLNYPCLIIEVLSPSTELTDRREKLVNYRDLERLQEYVLVSQNEIKVEVYRQDAQGNWSLTILGKDDELRLDSIGLTLTMTEIYEDVIKI
ncbi:MAG: Uma2 family endonuclease [Aulosira sp. DedQUE10]|nr:Uma2 family endonuclease [Aulosira sp. DedQUE10]